MPADPNPADPSAEDPPPPTAPEARVVPDRKVTERPTYLWWLTVLSVLAAIGLFIGSSALEGPRVTVTFDEGHGLEERAAVRYRGVEIGRVRSIEVSSDLGSVVVELTLSTWAAPLARDGARFWIERPRIGLEEGIAGLETVVGGPYIECSPGPRDGAPRRVFEGLEEPPGAERPTGGVELIVSSRAPKTLRPGAPVTHRGVRVGHVLSIGLSSDSVEVDARVWIGPEHRELVRENTVFWVSAGFEVEVGFTGVALDADSLATIAAGGIALATPAPPGPVAAMGRRFELRDEAPKDWKDWTPRIAIGSELLASGDGLLPHPVRAKLVWTERTLGFKDRESREGWIVPISDGTFLGPRDLLEPPEDAIDGLGTLEAAGVSIALARPPETAAEDVAAPRAILRDALSGATLPDAAAWPAERVRAPARPEDAILVADPRAEEVVLGAGSLTPGDDGTWSIDESLDLDASEHHGAVLVSRDDGALIAVLVAADDEVRVIPVAR